MGRVEGLAARLKESPQDRGGWLRLANAWKVLGENANALDAYAKAHEIGMLFDVAKLGNAVLAAQPELDVTADFIAEFNASHP